MVECLLVYVGMNVVVSKIDKCVCTCMYLHNTWLIHNMLNCVHIDMYMYTYIHCMYIHVK